MTSSSLRRLLVSTIGLGLVVAAVPTRARADSDIVVGAHAWRILPRESGPVDYYTVMNDPSGAYVRARYVPPTETAVIGFQLQDGDKRRVHKLHWKWRAVTLPAGGDECASGKEDSAAVVYVTWKSGLRYKTLKYVWSAVGKKGRTCDRKRTIFSAQDTIILESGDAHGAWKTEDLDLDAEYRRHFEDGNPHAEVPDLIGIGLMTDGDQTRSESVADYGTFRLGR